MVGNDEGAAALEMTVTGPTLRFDADAVIALAGAQHGRDARRRRRAVLATASRCRAAACSRWARSRGAGQRAYLAVRGGFDVPEYLGSRATFTLGQFGGHGGRALRAGDVLRLNRNGLRARRLPRHRPRASAPTTRTHWQIARADGPHGAPDFFTAEDMRHVLRRGLGSALQLQPHRRAPDRAEAHLGAHGRRRGGTASVQHPRQRLRHRQRRLHRRHAGDPRARRPEPRRLRLPGDHRRRASCGSSASCGPGDKRALPANVTQPRARSADNPFRSLLDAAGRPPNARRRSACAARARATCWSSSARRCSTWCCASRCRRCSSSCSAQRTRRDHRSHPGHPLAADSFRSGAHHRRRSARLAAGGARKAAERRSHAPAQPHRAPAAVLGRSGDAARDRALQQSVRADAPWCPTTSSSSAASTGSNRARTCATSCSTRATS